MFNVEVIATVLVFKNGTSDKVYNEIGKKLLEKKKDYSCFYSIECKILKHASFDSMRAS